MKTPEELLKEINNSTISIKENESPEVFFKRLYEEKIDKIKSFADDYYYKGGYEATKFIKAAIESKGFSLRGMSEKEYVEYILRNIKDKLNKEEK